jgi:hypothetical protein
VGGRLRNVRGAFAHRTADTKSERHDEEGVAAFDGALHRAGTPAQWHAR